MVSLRDSLWRHIVKQLTVRNLPEPVAKRLRDKARREGRSLNGTVAVLLADSLGVGGHQRKHRDLTGIAGTWTESEAAEFARNTALFESIDEELWQ